MGEEISKGSALKMLGNGLATADLKCEAFVSRGLACIPRQVARRSAREGRQDEARAAWPPASIRAYLTVR